MSEDTLSNVPLRAVLWIGFFSVILTSWAVLYVMADSHGGGGGHGAGMAMEGPGLAIVFAMWALMIGAMMLPTLAPALKVYGDLPARSGAGPAGWLGVIMGYVAVWLPGAAGFAALQVVAAGGGLVDMNGIVTSPWLSVALLVVAGLYQFSRFKGACQSVCMSPLQYYLANWRPGMAGGLRMGAGLGVNCMGCCWAIMALAFVGGMSSLLWMGVATLFMVLEKLPEIGAWLRRPAGTALMVMALYLALQAAETI